MTIADEQVKTRREAVLLNPLKKLDDSFEQEYKKGEVSGIMLFQVLPRDYIEDLEEQIETRLEEEKANEKPAE